MAMMRLKFRMARALRKKEQVNEEDSEMDSVGLTPWFDQDKLPELWVAISKIPHPGDEWVFVESQDTAPLGRLFAEDGGYRLESGYPEDDEPPLEVAGHTVPDFIPYS